VDVKRRDFLKAFGATTAGVLIPLSVHSQLTKPEDIWHHNEAVEWAGDKKVDEILQLTLVTTIGDVHIDVPCYKTYGHREEFASSFGQDDLGFSTIAWQPCDDNDLQIASVKNFELKHIFTSLPKQMAKYRKSMGVEYGPRACNMNMGLMCNRHNLLHLTFDEGGIFRMA
jgi:hypothetical protein